MTDPEAAAIRRQVQAIISQADALRATAESLLESITPAPEPEPETTREERAAPRTMG